MKIKLVHAHFLISIGDYSNERVGFTAQLEEGEKVSDVVATLRQQAVEAVGHKAKELYEQKWQLEKDCQRLESKLNQLRSEWDSTAEFLRAQGIKPEAPSMPQFNRLIAAAKVEEESVTAEIVEDNIPFEAGDTPNSTGAIPDGF
jgi:predicted nuclease with TOPRIM domain